MSLEILIESIPNYAKDIRINLGNVLKQPELTPTQLWGTAVACAVTTRTPAVIRAIEAEALQHVDEQTVNAAKTAAAVMAMNNVWYRFQHMSEAYAQTPARLRMQTLRSHGADHVDFELWCTAVSAINNCHVCVTSHDKAVREKGLTEEHVAASVRIAAVIQAAATAIAEETARL